MNLKNNRLVKKSIKKSLIYNQDKIDVNELNEHIIKEEIEIRRQLFKHYFKFQMLTVMLKTLYNLNDRKRNNELVNTIRKKID